MPFDFEVASDKMEVNCFGFTRAVIETLNIRWEISNFSYINADIVSEIVSPLFSSKQNPRIKWCLKFYPGGTEEDADHCAIYLHNIRESENVVTAEATFAVIDIFNRECEKYEMSREIYEDTNEAWGTNTFIKKRCLLRNKAYLLKDDKLIISCTCNATIDASSIRESIDSSIEKNSVSTFLTVVPIFKKLSVNQWDISQCFEIDLISDIQLISTEGHIFNAHKIFLCSASQIFLKMIQQSASKNITFNDVSTNILKEMLRYIYTRDVKNLSDIANELVTLAYKYHIEGLKELCEKSLCKQLTTENLFDMLAIAYNYNLHKLKENILDLFILHKNELVSTVRCEELRKSQPEVIADLFVTLVADKRI